MSKDFMRVSKKKVSCRRLGGNLKEQKGRLYIIRRCVVMLLYWHDYNHSHQQELFTFLFAAHHIMDDHTLESSKS
ncbi:hypothetical protein GLYMA_02G099000v4 [Glycine max]|uniref:Uncharacterized protein n=3 Tax=Glycine subgen. Soja TaxID=1462606 RepID=I1JDW1_SOYBN|nr:hypothetical protein JHK87_003536 [Glycine soja]KAG5062659.1 hypothetical protein JHK85_003842 [Glycine max]KAG5079612.1 hypothetical protein JHK86_003677 [Glycine max]KAH1059615.1 hypothetical protein GYH30_003559 [Glycine max]KRH70597.1 hypothetical protein GLYMA_02G099000v4 [Glycine max]|eukprot:XP_003520041.2 uncharacterized protein LOC100806978 [Glycine max]